MLKDRQWIEEATYTELADALRTEPWDSELFSGGDLTELFWITYRNKVAELWSDACPYLGEKNV